MRKPKPKVLDIPLDKQEAAQKLLDSNFKHPEINSLSGICCICGRVAQKIVKSDITDADDDGKVFRIQRFCDKDFQRFSKGEI